jgi:hypothetical protein
MPASNASRVSARRRSGPADLLRLAVDRRCYPERDENDDGGKQQESQGGAHGVGRVRSLAPVTAAPL